MSAPALFNLSGKRALITGSSRGLGFAFALGLAEAGAEIIINSRDAEALGAAAKTLADKGFKVSALAFDISSSDSIDGAIEHAESHIGPIDILINNAGQLSGGALLDFDVEKFERLMTVNVDGVFKVSKAVAPHMIARKSGKIINISSASAKIGKAKIIPYAASKAAVESLTRGMAAEWAPQGLNVNAIAPGFIAAGMNELNIDNPDINAFITSRVPAGRWGQTNDLIGAAVFFASGASDYINGQTLIIDGGLTSAM